MNSMIIYLNKIDDITNFLKITNNSSGEFYIKSDKYIVDGKSLLGLFSLDLSKPIILEYDKTIDKEVIESLKKYEVKDII